MNILLIWNEIPERVRVFRLENLSQEEAARVLACHGLLVNSDESPDLDWLNLQVYGPDGTSGVWKEEPADKLVQINGGWTVVVSGFVL